MSEEIKDEKLPEEDLETVDATDEPIESEEAKENDKKEKKNKHKEERLKLEKKIEELEDFNRRASADIKAYNACIDGVIAGQMTFCDWCEENPECKLEAKGKGCSLWWLKEITPEDVKTYVLSSNKEESDESKGILGASPEG